MIAVPFLLFALVTGGLWLAIHHLVPAFAVAGVRVWQWLLRVLDRHPRLAAGRRALARRTEPVHGYLPAVLIALAGAVAAVAAGNVFMELAEAIEEQSAVTDRIDQWVWSMAPLYRGSPATAFFTFFTIVGLPVVLGAAVVVAAAILAVKKRPRWAAYLLLTTGIGGILNRVLKELFERQRPDLAEAIRSATGHSFPSGHAMGATIVCGAFTYLALRALPGWNRKSAAIALAITTVLAIGVSRLYLGVHWLTDVVAGVSAGLVWVIATTVAYDSFRRARLARSRHDSRALER